MQTDTAYIVINSCIMLLWLCGGFYAVLWFFKFSFRKRLVRPPSEVLIVGYAIGSFIVFMDNAFRKPQGLFPEPSTAAIIVIGGYLLIFYGYHGIVAIRKRLPER